MRLKVRHTTVYTYAEPFAYLIQAIRLTPRPHDGLAIHRWQVTGTDGRALPATADGFGNVVLTQTITRETDTVEISVEGEVETRDTFGVVRGAPEPLPPLAFMQPTRATQTDDAIAELADWAAAGRANDLDLLHRLMRAIGDRINRAPASADAQPTASAALASGRGVPADHSHVMIAAAQHLGYPARYVSGYLWTSDDDVAPANHAWTEVHVADLGWVGFDPANGLCPTEAYVRVATGRSLDDAAPVRGIRRGGASERLSVAVQIAAGIQAQQQQQQ